MLGHTQQASHLHLGLSDDTTHPDDLFKTFNDGIFALGSAIDAPCFENKYWEDLGLETKKSTSTLVDDIDESQDFESSYDEEREAKVVKTPLKSFPVFAHIQQKLNEPLYLLVDHFESDFVLDAPVRRTTEALLVTRGDEMCLQPAMNKIAAAQPIATSDKAPEQLPCSAPDVDAASNNINKDTVDCSSEHSKTAPTTPVPATRKRFPTAPATPANLKKVVYNAEGNRIYPCNICGQPFDKPQRLGQHSAFKHPGQSATYNYRQKVREMNAPRRKQRALLKQQRADKSLLSQSKTIKKSLK